MTKTSILKKIIIIFVLSIISINIRYCVAIPVSNYDSYHETMNVQAGHTYQFDYSVSDISIKSYISIRRATSIPVTVTTLYKEELKASRTFTFIAEETESLQILLTTSAMYYVDIEFNYIDLTEQQNALMGILIPVVIIISIIIIVIFGVLFHSKRKGFKKNYLNMGRKIRS